MYPKYNPKIQLTKSFIEKEPIVKKGKSIELSPENKKYLESLKIGRGFKIVNK